MTQTHEHYVIERDEEYQVVMVTFGSDPLYGRGTWNYAAGPFATYKEADKKADELFIELFEEE